MTTGRVGSRTLLWLSLWESAGHLIRAWRLMLPAFLIVVSDILWRAYQSDLLFSGGRIPDSAALGRYQLITRFIFAGWITLAMASVAQRISEPGTPNVAQRVGKSLFLAFVLWNLAQVGFFFSDSLSFRLLSDGRPPEEWQSVTWSFFAVGALIQTLVVALAGAWLGVKMVEDTEGVTAFQSALRCLRDRPVVYLALALILPVLQVILGRVPMELTMLAVAIQFGAYVLVTAATLSGEELPAESGLPEPITARRWAKGLARALEAIALLGVFAVLAETLLGLPRRLGVVAVSSSIEPTEMFSAARTGMAFLESVSPIPILSALYTMLLVYVVTRANLTSADFWRRVRKGYPACLAIEALGILAASLPRLTWFVLPSSHPTNAPIVQIADIPFVLLSCLILARATAAQAVAVRDQIGAREAFDRSSFGFRRNFIPLVMISLVGTITWMAVQPHGDTPLVYLAAIVSAFTVALIAAIFPTQGQP